MFSMALRIYTFVILLSSVYAATTTESNPLLSETCKDAGMDIVFLLDTSSSIWLPDFMRQIKFVKDVVKQFDLGQGQTQTRVGVSTFANSYYLQFHLWQNNRMTLLSSALNRIRHRAGKYTNTGKALNFAAKYMFSHRYGSRKHALHVIVLITDGRSQNRKATLEASEFARDKGIYVFAIGVGSATDEKELRRIANEPSDDFYYKVDRYKSLDAIKFVLANRACHVEEEPEYFPRFLDRPTNVTVVVGETATLMCAVEDLGVKTVIWRKQPYPIPITVGTTLLVKDPARIELQYVRERKEWNLVIKNVQPVDTGVYECQFSAKNELLGRNVTLHVIDTTQGRTVLTTPPVTTPFPFNVIPNNRMGPLSDIDPRLNVTNCGGKPAEIYFALDASNSIWPEDFKKQLAFVQDLISLFDIHNEKTRIGLITFSDGVTPIITLDHKQDKQSLFAAMRNITYMSGRTDTGEALKFIREHGFSPDVARREVAHIILLFTDGLSRYPRKTAREAELARRDGIYLFSIGIGTSVEKTELNDMASDPDEDFVFHVINFNVLNTIKDILAIKTCAVEPMLYSDQASIDCKINRRTDLMFVYDSAQIGMHKTRKITEFVYDVSDELHKLDGSRKLKLGRLTENCLTGADVYLTNQRSAMDFTEVVFPDFRRMIRKLAGFGFSPQYGGTYGAKKVAVLFLDDDMENLKQAADEVRRLRETHTYVVTIGDVATSTAAAFTSQPPLDHIVHIPSYQFLSTVKSTLLHKLCKVLEI